MRLPLGFELSQENKYIFLWVKVSNWRIRIRVPQRGREGKYFARAPSSKGAPKETQALEIS